MKMGASRALEELARLMPSQAHKILADGSVFDVAIEKLVLGDKELVKPAKKIPVDGFVVEGETSVNESMLTGESKPVTKSSQDPVIGGSLNGEGVWLKRRRYLDDSGGAMRVKGFLRVW